MNLDSIIQYSKDLVKANLPEFNHLVHHLPEVEKWAKKILKEYPDADSEIVLASVWLHDIGQITGDKSIDHAISSEEFVLKTLPSIIGSSDKISQIAHCVRTHRCKDIQPETLEAKILTISDSLSHMTDYVYIDYFQDGRIDEALEKVERDYHDKSLLDLSFKDKIDDLYKNWKLLLISLKKVDD